MFNNNNNVVENDDNKNNNVLLAVPYITCDLDIDWYVCVLFISINFKLNNFNIIIENLTTLLIVFNFIPGKSLSLQIIYTTFRLNNDLLCFKYLKEVTYSFFKMLVRE